MQAALAPCPTLGRPFAAAQHRRLPSPSARSAALRVDCGTRSSATSLAERAAKGAAAVALSALLAVGGASARLEGVNKPELLPKGEFTPVIDIASFLTDGEERRIRQRVEDLERDTGIKLRVLAQNYPETPGLAIKDYWGVDADTVVMVADPNTGNILNFNVAENVDFRVPRSFWSRLAGRYGTKFYWQEKGPDVSIMNAVAAIDNCLREPMGRGQCSSIRGELE